MKNIKWEIRYTSPPPVLKHCKNCGAQSEYTSSGLFRVNAQRKYLDVWLVYKCKHCDSTWNMAIFSRIHPQNLRPGLLEKFYRNDCKLAEQYAMDAALLAGNGVKTGLPEYEILGENGFLSEAEPVKLEITSVYPSPIKVSSILRKKLSLSQREWNQWIESGLITADSGQDLSKCKLQNGIVLKICPTTKSGLERPDF